MNYEKSLKNNIMESQETIVQSNFAIGSNKAFSIIDTAINKNSTGSKAIAVYR